MLSPVEHRGQRRAAVLKLGLGIGGRGGKSGGTVVEPAALLRLFGFGFDFTLVVVFVHHGQTCVCSCRVVKHNIKLFVNARVMR